MSRSYRKPFSACTGTKSAKDDKRRANRGVRHKQNQWLRTLEDYDSALVPHRLECAWNEVYSWGRDGHQYLQVPSQREWADYHRTSMGVFTSDFDRDFCLKYDDEWPPEWYVRLQRK